MGMTRVAIIGAGAIAREHARAFQAQPGVELVSIQSRTASKAEAVAAEFSIRHVARSIPELYEVGLPDLVVIAVTIPATRQTCLACLEHEAALLVEKPLGLNLAECEEIVTRAAALDRKGYVAFNRRHYASTQWVQDGLKGLNGPRFIRIEDQEDTDAAALDGHAQEVVENWMYANSIHMIDLARQFGRGEIVSVSPLQPYKGPDETLAVVAEIEFESGDIALYECIWNAQGPWAATVHTRERRFELRPVETAFYQTREQRTRHPMPDAEIDSAYKPGFFMQAKSAVSAVRGEPHTLATFEDALETTRLTHRIFGR
jgi:predicted dehydrogenase